MLNKDLYHEDNRRNFCFVCGSDLSPVSLVGNWFLCARCAEKLGIRNMNEENKEKQKE